MEIGSLETLRPSGQQHNNPQKIDSPQKKQKQSNKIARKRELSMEIIWLKMEIVWLEMEIKLEIL